MKDGNARSVDEKVYPCPASIIYAVGVRITRKMRANFGPAWGPGEVGPWIWDPGTRQLGRLSIIVIAT